MPRTSMSHLSAFFSGTVCTLLAPVHFVNHFTFCGCLYLVRSFSGNSTIQMPASFGEGSMKEVRSLMRHLGLVTSVERQLVRLINSTIVTTRVREN